MGQQAAKWARTATDRASWRALAEGSIMLWKDTIFNRIDRVMWMGNTMDCCVNDSDQADT